jgi:hypothetical protein
VSKDRLVLSIRWMIERDVVICCFLNRISRRPNVKAFFVSISDLGDGGAWYALILLLPLVYGPTGLTTSFDMVRVGVVNLLLYKIIKQLTGRPRPSEVSTSITAITAPWISTVFLPVTPCTRSLFRSLPWASSGIGFGARSSLSNGRDFRRYDWRVRHVYPHAIVKPQRRLICSTQLICSTRQRAKFSFG